MARVWCVHLQAPVWKWFLNCLSGTSGHVCVIHKNQGMSSMGNFLKSGIQNLFKWRIRIVKFDQLSIYNIYPLSPDFNRTPQNSFVKGQIFSPILSNLLRAFCNFEWISECKTQIRTIESGLLENWGWKWTCYEKWKLNNKKLSRQLLARHLLNSNMSTIVAYLTRSSIKEVGWKQFHILRCMINL